MALTTKNGRDIDQYYNRFSPDNNYDEVLLRDGRPVIASELNELQSILNHKRKSIADHIFSNGDVASGGQISVNSKSGEVRVEAGDVYADGRMWAVPAAIFNIPVTGTYAIGVYISEEIVSEHEDPNLLNPALGTRSSGLAGAWRRKLTASWGASSDGNSDPFYPVYTVDDAVVRAKETPPSYDAMSQAIAQYDCDSTGTGTYIASGLVVTQAPNDSMGRQVYSIAAGRYRIKGQGLGFQQDQQVIYAAAPRDSEIIHNDGEVVVATGDASQRVNVAHPPIWKDRPVLVKVPRRQTITITHTTNHGGIDAIVPGNILRVVRVYQGDVVFTEKVDFNVVGDSLDWSLPGSEPSAGATYQVEYDRYSTEEPLNLDYDGFTVEGAQGGYTIFFTYDYVLPRIDKLCVDIAGRFEWLAGVASAYSPKPPAVPSNLLPLATVGQLWRGDTTRPFASNRARSFSMEDFYDLSDRLNWVIDELSRTRLENDISIREAGARVGLMVDPFADDSMRDEGIAQTAAVVEGWLTLPIAAEAYSLDELSSPEVLPYTLHVALEQLLRTSSMKINPYMVFSPLPAEMKITPAVDYWSETRTSYKEETKYFYQNRTVYKTVNGGTIIQNKTVNRTTSVKSQAGTTTKVTGSSVQSSVSRSVSTSTSTSTSTSLTTTGTAKIANLRPISLSYEIKGFGGGENLKQMTFAGVPVTISGATTADNDGKLAGRFTIPSGISAGTKQVLAEGQSGTLAVATFTGQGTITYKTLKTTHNVTQIKTTTVTTTNTTIQQTQTTKTTYVKPVNPDPLAQTFTLETDCQLAAVDLFFTKRGNSRVKIRIVEVENGFPTQNVLAEGSIEPSKISTTDYSRIFFDDFYKAVTLEAGIEYALVVMTDDGTTEVAIAKLGDFDRVNQKWVTAQAYTVGTLLSSSNASTWTAHQDCDLCFRLIEAVASATSKTVKLGTVSGLEGITDLILKASAEYPDSTCGVTFLLKIPDANDTTTEIEMAEDQALDLGGEISGDIEVSAVLTSASKLSPGLAPGAQLITGKVASEGTYIMRSMNCSGATNLSIIYDGIIPSGAGVKVEIRKDADGVVGDFEELPQQSSTPQADGVYEYRYGAALDNIDLVKLKLTLTGTPTARPLVSDLRMIATK